MRHQVTDTDTAAEVGSGDVPVLATPRLVAWLEAATVEAAAPHLASGHTSVGTAVRLQHLRPTAVGGSITVEAELVSSPGERRMTYAVTAVDDSRQVVATGEIDRVVVDRERFVASVGGA